MALTNQDLIDFFGKIDYAEVKAVTGPHLLRLQTMLNSQMDIPADPGATPDDAGLFIYRHLRSLILHGEDSIAEDIAREARPTEL